jgi:hypothetical protein
LEFGELAANSWIVFLRLLAVDPIIPAAVAEVDRLYEFGDAACEVIEHLLALEIGPLRQYYFVL